MEDRLQNELRPAAPALPWDSFTKRTRSARRRWKQRPDLGQFFERDGPRDCSTLAEHPFMTTPSETSLQCHGGSFTKRTPSARRRWKQRPDLGQSLEGGGPGDCSTLAEHRFITTPSETSLYCHGASFTKRTPSGGPCASMGLVYKTNPVRAAAVEATA